MRSLLVVLLGALLAASAASAFTVYDMVNTFDGNGTGAANTTGKIGTALNFTGVSSSNVTYETTNITLFQNMTGRNITVSAWINLNSVSGGNYFKNVLSNGDSGTGYQFGLLDDYPVVFSGNTYDTNGGIATDTQLAPGQWYHVVWSVDFTGTVTIYVDGVAQNTTTPCGPGITSPALPEGMTRLYSGGFSIAACGGFYDGTQSLNASIDEMGFWADRLLDQTAVDELYNSGNGTNLSSLSAPTVSKLVAYWSFDSPPASREIRINLWTDFANCSALDETGHHTATIPATYGSGSGTLVYSNTTKPSGLACSLDMSGNTPSNGADGINSFIQYPYNAQYSDVGVVGTDPFTMLWWYNSSSTTDKGIAGSISGGFQSWSIITGVQPAAGDMWFYQQDASENSISLCDGSGGVDNGCGTSGGSSDGNWHMFELKYTGGSYEMYVDNVLEATSGNAGDTKNTGSDIFVGFSPQFNLAGLDYLAQFAIINDTLSATEQACLYNGGAGRTYDDFLASCSVMVAATPPAPVANFTSNTTTGLVPLSVQFNDTSTNTPTSWLWYFGDGTNSTLQNPAHNYSVAGNYTVNLTATNAGGSDSEVKTNYIQVIPRPAAVNVTITPSPFYNSFTLYGNYTLVNYTGTDQSVFAWYKNGALIPSCYQEQANVSTACGGLATGSYSSFSAEPDEYVTANYTVPTGYVPEKAYVTMGLTPTSANYTLPNVCVQAAVSSGRYVGRLQSHSCNTINCLGWSRYECYNGTGYTTVVQFNETNIQGSGGGSETLNESQIRELVYDGNHSTYACWNAVLGSVWRSTACTLSSDLPTRNNFRIYEEGVWWGATAAALPAGATTTGDNVTFQITPSNGTLNGTPVNSSTITIIADVVANFTSNVTTGTAPLAVQFTDTSTGNITSRLWTFGDGTNSTLQNPTKTFQYGNFTVSLRVTDSYGTNNTTTVTNYIQTSRSSLFTPVASNVSINPTNPYDTTNLTGAYNITNASGYNYTVSTFRWYRVNDSSVLSTSSTLSSTLTSERDQIKFEVTPKIVCTQGDYSGNTTCGAIASAANEYVASTSFSFGNSNDGATDKYSAIFNYTKPIGATNASTIFARTGANTTGGTPTSLLSANYSISSSCWNAYSDKVRFGFRIGRGSPVTPFYSEFVELFCYNNTGSWERFYYAGHGTVAGCDNPNGAAAAAGTINAATDNDLNSYVCVSSSYGLNAQPSASYFGNPACGRTPSCSAVSAGTVAGFQMNWVSEGAAVNSSTTTILSVPVASNVTVSQSGTADTDLLVGNYVFSDYDNDTENGSTYKWYFVSNGTIFNTSRNATIGTIANGVLVRFEVTPKSAGVFGSAVNSSDYAVLRKQAPVASNVSIYQNGTNPTDYLFGNYTYSDVDNDTENGTTFRWYYTSNSSVFSTARNLSIGSIANGTTIRFEVTPRDSYSNGTSVNSSDYNVSARVAPTIALVLLNSSGQPVYNSSNLMAASNLNFFSTNYTHYNFSESGAALYITYIVNGTTTVLNQTVNAVALTNHTSTTFQLVNYMPYTYTVTAYDQWNKTSTYTGNLLAGNQQPNITAVQTYRGGTLNNCQADTVCEVRILLSEDACTLARQNENIVVLDPSNNTLLNDTALALTLNSGGQCQYKSDSFIPLSAGSYPYSVYFTDYGGLSDTETGNFTIVEATQPPPAETPTTPAETVVTPAAAGGAAGGVIIETIILKQEINQSFQIVPEIENIVVRLAGNYEGEFQVVNDGLFAIMTDIQVNKALSSDEIQDWLDFAGTESISGLQINPGQGLNSNSKFIRYTIDSKRIIPVGKYKIVLDVTAGGVTKQHTINVDVRSSVWAEFDEFWNKEVLSLGEKCIDSSTANVDTNTTTSTERTCSPKTIIKVKHVVGLLILGSLGAMIAVGARTRRVRRQKNI